MGKRFPSKGPVPASRNLAQREGWAEVMIHKARLRVWCDCSVRKLHLMELQLEAWSTFRCHLKIGLILMALEGLPACPSVTKEPIGLLYREEEFMTRL